MKSLFNFKKMKNPNPLKVMSMLLDIFLFTFFATLAAVVIALYIKDLATTFVACALASVCVTSILVWFKERKAYRVNN